MVLTVSRTAPPLHTKNGSAFAAAALFEGPWRNLRPTNFFIFVPHLSRGYLEVGVWYHIIHVLGGALPYDTLFWGKKKW